MYMRKRENKKEQQRTTENKKRNEFVNPTKASSAAQAFAPYRRYTRGARGKTEYCTTLNSSWRLS